MTVFGHPGVGSYHGNTLMERGSVVSGFQYLSQVQGHLCPGGGAQASGASPSLDMENVPWPEVGRRSDPGGVGPGGVGPGEQRQVGSRPWGGVPLDTVLGPPADAVPPHGHLVLEVRLGAGPGGLQVGADGPGLAGGTGAGLVVLVP